MGVGEVIGALAAALLAAAAGDNGYLRGVHYFGDVWPVNFWDSFRAEGAAADFEAIKQDGFNTVVFVVPWGAFQPTIHPVRSDEELFGRLVALVRTAGKAGLRVVLRIGYEWDFAPGIELHHERFAKVFTDASVQAAWVAFAAELWKRIGNEPNFAFAFLSWEDFWSFGMLTRGSPSQRLEAAGTSGYRAWLRTDRGLDDVSTAYGTKFASWEQVPIPATRKPGYELFLAFQDHLLLDRLFKPARERFPRLSMEVRVDQDPVVRDGRETWVSHAATFALPGAPYTTAYYAVAMGADAPELGAARTLELMRWILSGVREHARAPLFVDQFVPYDNTPAFAGSPKVKASELPAFVEQAAQVLARYAAGYALWTYRNYASDVIFNARFELGARGWTTAGKVEVQPGRAVLAPGASLRQEVPAARTEVATFSASKQAKLCVIARGPAAIRVRTGASSKRFDLPATTGERCANVPIRRAYTVSVEAISGTPAIEKVGFFAFVAEGKVRAVDDSPLELLPSIRRVNAALAEVRIAEHYDRAALQGLSGVYSDGWMGRSIRGEIRVPALTGRSVFRVTTHLPADWPDEPVLHLTLGDSEVDVPCKRGGGTVEVPAGTLKVTAGQIAAVALDSTSTVVPKDRGLGADQRALACQVTELGFVEKR